MQDSEDDYLVDHSIITYLINPEVRERGAAALLCPLPIADSSALQRPVLPRLTTSTIPSQGKFLTFYGKNFTADEMATNISDHIRCGGGCCGRGASGWGAMGGRRVGFDSLLAGARSNLVVPALAACRRWKAEHPNWGK